VGRVLSGVRPIYGSTMIFLGKKFEQELVWTVTCKGCGERYFGCRLHYPATQTLHLSERLIVWFAFA
jgi:hypothetical protein